MNLKKLSTLAMLIMFVLGAAFAQSNISVNYLGNNNTMVKFKANQKYLLMPIEESAPEAQVSVLINGEIMQQMNVRLAQGKKDYLVPLDLKAWQGKDIVLNIRTANDRSNVRDSRADVCWKQMGLSNTFDTANVEKFRPAYHHTPLYGWMNDPNGLVEKDEVYHIYYQYSYEPEGGLKYWKQFTTKDFLHYQDEGIALSPDHPHDQGGAYSGCCFNDHGLLRYFYTGNVKLPGDYDYINAGREHNVMKVDSQDGLVLDHKEVVLYNKDYPQNMSCHVRDPYVYENDGMYYMVLGARTLDSHGCVILYSSKDLNFNSA